MFEKELCVRCGKTTLYDISTPIEMRRWFVEGAGQLCEECYSYLYRLPAGFMNDVHDGSKDKSDIKDKTMLEEFIKTKDLKAFNVNMYENNRTLHINSEIVGPGKQELFSKNGEKLPARKCYYEKPDQFIPFDSLEDVEAFEKQHSCSFRRCGNCFPKSMRGN